jgi:hypothetical protein
MGDQSKFGISGNRECGLLRYAGFMGDKESAADQRIASGLCSDCVHARQLESARGSFFLFCNLSLTDSRFAKYPRLPVLSCGGYVKGHPSSDAALSS